MRVLFVYPYLPSPEAPHGGARLVSSQLAALRDRAHVTLVCAYRPAEQPLLPGVRALVSRLIAVPRPFREDLGFPGRCFETASMAWKRLRTALPLPVLKLRRAALIRGIRLGLESDAGIVHFEGSPLAQYASLLQNRPSVLMDHEVGGPGDEVAGWSAYLRRSYPRFDKVLVLGEEERDRLLARVPDVDVEILRPGLPLPPAPERHPEADRVLFFASPVHAPNRDALAWVATEILPALRRLRPSARVVCAGFPCGLQEARAAAAAGAEMPGFVPDLRRELARAAVVLSPLRAGGGVRIKNVETLLEGAPLVTTPRGAEGLGAGSGEAWLVAEDAAGLARACAGLLADPPRAEALGARGRELAIARFDAATRTDHLLRIWAALASRAPRAGRAP